MTEPEPASTEQARALARQGRIADAENAYRRILASTPDATEALNFVAMCELAQGDIVAAQRKLERAVELEPGQPEIWKSLGLVHLGADRAADAIAAFDHALQLDPNHFVVRLHRGAAMERLGRTGDAVASYYGAIVAAQDRGMWMNEATTAPGLRKAVTHAMRSVNENRRRLFLDLLAPLRQQHGGDALQRVERGLAIYLGDAPANYPDPRQQPKFFYVPGLPTQALFPRELFPWYEPLEAAMPEIRREMLNVMAEDVGFEPFLGHAGALQDLLDHQRDETPAWDAFFFDRHGRRNEANAARCPITTAAIDAAPLCRIRDHSPEVCFSVLTAGSHILPHRGVTNTRVVTHLPLVVPEGDLALNVGGELQRWQEGRCFSFDDTFEHEAWNRSGKTRVVVLMDAWNPYLTEAEREALTALIGGIGDFNRAAGV